MTNFIKLNELDPFQLQDLRTTSYQLAQNEIENRRINDPSGEETLALADYLVQEAERWASVDESDVGSEDYEVVFEEFFTN